MTKKSGTRWQKLRNLKIALEGSLDLDNAMEIYTPHEAGEGYLCNGEGRSEDNRATRVKVRHRINFEQREADRDQGKKAARKRQNW